MGMEQQFIFEVVRLSAVSATAPSGDSYFSLSLQESIALAERCSISRRELEVAALEAGVVPERYQRSIGTLGLKGQIRLLKSRVALIGAGGLGGLSVELLARMGVGSLVVVDGDSFADSNLNRQLYSSEKNIGEGKAEVAASRAREINGAVEVRAINCFAAADNLLQILEGCNLALDCLDNLSSRFDLEEACQKLQIPMVHGAIAGSMGQIAVIRPGHPLLSSIYGSKEERGGDRGAEVILGNPAATPAMLSAWQVNEGIKVLAGLEDPLYDKLMLIEMKSAQTSLIDLL